MAEQLERAPNYVMTVRMPRTVRDPLSRAAAKVGAISLNQFALEAIQERIKVVLGEEPSRPV